MIALTIAYGTIVGCGFALAALLIERALRVTERQTRGVWIAAMVGTLVLTGMVVQRIGRPIELVESIQTPEGPATRTTRPVPGGVSTTTTHGVPPAPAPTWWERLTDRRTIDVAPGRMPASVDRFVGVLWLLGSAAWLLTLLASARAIQRQQHGWAREVVGDTPVYVSHDVGPAVFGVLRPSIVLPSWVTTLDDMPRALIVRHEREHVHGRDQALLAASTICVAIMPLNAALWWMYARLRSAVEMDCDRRVLAQGIAPKDYGSLLVDMGERMLAGTVPVAALAESRSLTKRRLVAMLSQRPRFATIKSLAFLALGVVVAAGATRAPRPAIQVQPPLALAPLEMNVWISEARLLIPFPRRATWEWDLPYTGNKEYGIEVMVAGDTGYTYGFSYWKGTGGPTQRGDLLALMRQGQKTFWQHTYDSLTVNADGSTRRVTKARAVDGMPVTVEPVGDSVLVTLGAGAIGRTFRSKPATVTLTISTPYEPERKVTIPVVYRY